MKRKAVGIVLFCLVLLAAIVAGYWDMLTAEKLRVVREKASDAVGEIAAIVRTDAGRPATTAAPDPAPTATVPAGPTEPAGENGAVAAAPPAEPPAPAAVQTQPRVTADGSPADDAAPPPPETAAIAPTEAAAANPPPPPTFDIVRVEPDGSTVLAGRAPPGAMVKLMDGTTAIGSQTANAGGEFVIVLDEPLAVGGHQIRIEAETGDGRQVTSKETAIFSIPQAGRENELLAMVEAPDKASRLISIPAAPAAEPAAAESLAAAPAPETGDLLLPPSPAAGTPAGAPQAETDEAAVEPPVAEAPAATPPPAEPGAAATLAVEAVEIEDDTIYVAGRATGGSVVRIYIDNNFLAEDRGLMQERFLVTAKTPVGTGEHTVRADALDAAGTVVARVEVPFFKPEGRAMSAISSAPSTPGEAGVAETVSGPASAAAGVPETDPIPADAGRTDVAAASPLPTAPAAEAFAPPSGDSAGTADGGSAAAGGPVAAGAGAPDEAAASSTVRPEAPRAGDSVLADRMAATTPDVSTSAVAAPIQVDPAAPEPVANVAAATTNSGPSGDAAGPGVTVIRQPALEAAQSRVIIRRGDTLWRISRDTYGIGRRYTVIYLANGDQIRNPDRIYPGQVFRVPENEEAGSAAPGG